MLDPITVGKNIKKYREKLKITQQELATRLYVSYQAVSAWERGVALPDLENTAKLADVFNVKIDALLSNNTSTYLIAIDGGGTKTEFILFDKEGHVKKSLLLPGSNPNDIGIDGSIDLISDGIDKLTAHHSVSAVFAGIAGVTTGSHRLDLQKALANKYGIPFFVDTDAVNALALGNTPENTASVICGTGSCVFVRKNYQLTRLGGWGYLFDRAGSAYDVGNDAIRHALAVHDGLEAPSSLSALVTEKAGGDIWKGLSAIYELGRPHVATFAPLVVQAAEQGDSVALAILEANAERLASLLRLAVSLHGAPKEFVCTGGFFKNTVFLDTVERMAEVSLISPPLPPVFGAALECMRLNGLSPTENFKQNFTESYR